MEFQEIIEGCVAYAPGYIEADIGRMLFNHLIADVTWRQEHMTFGGGTNPATSTSAIVTTTS